jgi:hypothetical protein
MAKKPSTVDKLRALYDQLRSDHPTAAIGVASATMAILLITAAGVTQWSQEARYALLLLGVLFGLVGVAGFVLAMVRSRD